MKTEIRFYFCTILGYVLLLLGLYLPPLGIIPDSVLIGAGMLFILGGLVIGLDIKGVIREIRLLKEENYDKHTVQ